MTTAAAVPHPQVPPAPQVVHVSSGQEPGLMKTVMANAASIAIVINIHFYDRDTLLQKLFQAFLNPPRLQLQLRPPRTPWEIFKTGIPNAKEICKGFWNACRATTTTSMPVKHI
jgi:hypothetical protein